jgi:DNA replication initiation complex subunit (GINS family)
MKRFKKKFNLTYNMGEAESSDSFNGSESSLDHISHEYLFNILTREKAKQDLQSIGKTFYKEVLSVLKQKERKLYASMSQKSLVIDASDEKEKIEVKSIRKTISDIINLREKKVIMLALVRARIESTIINKEVMTYEEEEFFQDCVRLFRNFKDKTMDQKIDTTLSSTIQSGAVQAESQKTETQSSSVSELTSTNSEPVAETKLETTETQTQESEISTDVKTIKIKFLSPMTKFYGPKKKIYGPFEAGDSADIPEIVANILIKKGRAEKVENAYCGIN